MSSTSNVQDLLVNVFRPTYKYQPGTGFVPSLSISNVSEVIASRIKADALVISDSNDNTYIGANAGVYASNTASNVGIGYSAMGGAVNSSNNVALGAFSLDGVSNSSSNVAVGDRTDITGRGFKNVLLGPNVTMGDGSYNILIGADLSAGNGNYRFQLGQFLYGDLSLGRLGVNTSTPETALDVSGISYFRGKVGVQNPYPAYSLDVNGSLYVSDRFIVGSGTQATPIYGFRDLSSGMYQATDASYGTGAVGIAVNSMARLVVASNKTYIYGDLVVEGTGGGGGSGTIASNGTASAPSFTFSNDLSTGLHWAGTSILAFDTSGRQRMTLSNGFLGIGTPTPRVALDVSGDISANVYNGPGGTQTAPHYTFSDDRTTGVFFPGANIVGFTAGGTERMRISNSNIGIGTRAPSNALDVSGVLRVIGSAGNITFSNGTIDVSGTSLLSSSGGLVTPASTPNTLGGVTLASLDICMSLAGIIRAPIVRNALIPTTYDISGGNLSNSGTTRSSNFLAGLGATTAPAFSFGTVAGTGLYQASDASYGTGALGLAVNQSARVVVMSNKTILYGNLDICGTVSAAAGISSGGGGGGGTIATDGTAMAPSFTFSNDSTTGLYLQSASNLGFATGGVRRMTILNTGDVSAGQLVVSTYLRDTTTTSRTLDVSGGNISNSGTTRSSNFIGTDSASNRIGGVTLQDGVVTASNAERVYYVTSNTTLARPSGYSTAHVTLVGGGGGGAGAVGLRSGGGGGSGYIVQHLTPVLTSLEITIGTGGTGGTSGAAGGNGTVTTVLCDANYWMTAPGGGGGQDAIGSTSGAGGVGTYGGGGGGNGNSSTPGAGGIGKWVDGSTGGSGGAGSNGGFGGGGGGGGGPEGGHGGYIYVFGPGMEIGGNGYSGLRGGGGGGGGGGTMGVGNGGTGGAGYCIVRFLP